MSFDKFTHLYELSKTLRFELKPHPKTKKHLDLELDSQFSNDKYRKENREIIKYYSDLLHRDFIEDSLKDCRFDFQKYYEISKSKDSKEGQKNENNKSDGGLNNFERFEDKKDLRKKIAEKFTEYGNAKSKETGQYWVKVDKNKNKNKNTVSGILFGKELIGTRTKDGLVFKEFKNELGEDVEIPKLFFNKNGSSKKRKLKEVFNNFRGFTTNLADFFENRKNFYKAEGKTGQVATRIVDDNMPRFFDNLRVFEEIMDKYKNLTQNFSIGWPEYLREKKLENESWSEEFKKNNYNWEELLFKPNMYNQYFLQEGIDKYNYLIKKLNKDINEFGQTITNKKERKKIKIFQKLYKQIHGKVKKCSDFIEIDKENIFERIKEFIKHSDSKIRTSDQIINAFLNQKINIDNQRIELNLDQVYFSKRAVETISSKWFRSWNFLGEKILEKINKKLSDFIDLNLLKNAFEAENNEEFKNLLKPKFLENIKESEEKYGIKLEEFQQGKKWQNFLHVFKFEFDKAKKEYEETKKKYEEMPKQKYERNNKNQIEIIRNLAESSLAIYRMTNYFSNRKGAKIVEGKKYFPNRKDTKFYELVDKYLDGDRETNEEKCNIFNYYNALRNFISKKPFITDKIELYFEKSNLLGGWSEEYKEKGGNGAQFSGFIFKKDDKYFLGITDDCQLFNEFKYGAQINDLSSGAYKKMAYKQLKYMVVSGTIYNSKYRTNYNSKYRTKYSDDKTNLSDKEMIFKIKECLKTQEGIFPNIKLLTSKSYEKLSDLITDFNSLNPYSLSFNKEVSKKYVEKLKFQIGKKEKHLYLFQIYNKDFELDEEIGKKLKEVVDENQQGEAKRELRWGEKFKPGKTKGKENLHTFFFKLLFDPKNFNNSDGVVFKLSGGAKVFYRPRTKKEDWEKLEKTKSKYRSPRYKEDKYFLHLPIVQNFSNKGEKQVNDKLNEEIISKTDLNKFRIIGIDRGEKNLIYYSIIDTKRNIKELKSLNYIQRKNCKGEIIKEENIYCDKNGNIIEKKIEKDGKNYLNILEKKEIERLKARQSWQVIEQIKNTKNGYISQVVNILCEKIWQSIDEGLVPIIVLENLNQGFKRTRQKIERQVYQKLELQLAQKLNFLVDKKRGNYLKALQLTPKIKTFTNIKSQTGIVLYVNPDYTSAICPQCGFRRPDKINKYLKELSIEFKDGKYIIAYDYQTEKEKFKEEVFSDVKRILWDNDKKKMKTIENVTEEINKLFKNHGINKNGDINAQIKTQNFKFWQEFEKLFNLILRIRNSQKKNRKWNEETRQIEESGKDQDFLHCPKCHFHSDNDNGFQNKKWNGDANGAYHIALKGIIAINKIKGHYKDLEEWKNKWGIENLPKNKSDKSIKVKEFTLSIDKIKKNDNSKKEIFFYLLKKKSEKNNQIDEERKFRRYPNLFISNTEWDEDYEKFLAQKRL